MPWVPGLLGGQFAQQVDPLWRWTPAPYGSLALQIQHAVVDLRGEQPGHGPGKPVTVLVLISLTIVVCAPLMHPWYVLWGGLLLGLSMVDRPRLRVAIWVTALFAAYRAVVVLTPLGGHLAAAELIAALSTPAGKSARQRAGLNRTHRACVLLGYTTRR
jgi:hypothetical protein